MSRRTPRCGRTLRPARRRRFCRWPTSRVWSGAFTERRSVPPEPLELAFRQLRLARTLAQLVEARAQRGLLLRVEREQDPVVGRVLLVVAVHARDLAV